MGDTFRSWNLDNEQIMRLLLAKYSTYHGSSFSLDDAPVDEVPCEDNAAAISEILNKNWQKANK